MEKHYKHIIKVDGRLGGERRRTSEKDCHYLCHYLGQLKSLNVLKGGGGKGRERGEDIQEGLSLSLSLSGTAKNIKRCIEGRVEKGWRTSEKDWWQHMILHTLAPQMRKTDCPIKKHT